ncbi:MAG TPA: hypothetical protein VD816_05015 [Ohtaekwangia sp.]|nr:hypothetical protein [Ohtaekwangia sp.]
MKTISRLLVVFIATAFLMQACTDDEKSGSPEKVQFTFGVTTHGPENGRVSEVVLPPGTSLLLTLKNSDDETVLDHQRIELLKVGDHYLTMPIDLVPGRYKVVDFMLVTETDEVLYAAPRNGSPLANAVVHPLPFSFTVNKNSVTNIAMEVIDVSLSAPQDFGYASFDIGFVAGLPLQLSVMIQNENGFKLTTATATVVRYADTLNTYALRAGTNTIFLQGDSSNTFSVTVEKPGYNKYWKEFSYAALMDELNGSPLVVLLDTGVNVEDYYFTLDMDYINPTIEGGLYPGAFTMQDHSRIHFRIQNGTVVGDDASNMVGYIWPRTQSFGECVSKVNDDYTGALNVISYTAWVDYTSAVPRVYFDLVHGELRSADFFMLCGSDEPVSPGGELLSPIIESVSFELTGEERQSYVTADGMLTVSLESFR